MSGEEGEREREERERERERKNPKQAPVSVWSLMGGLDPTIGIMTRAEIKSSALNQLSHPGTPRVK